jgi:hypothetical protein
MFQSECAQQMTDFNIDIAQLGAATQGAREAT